MSHGKAMDKSKLNARTFHKTVFTKKIMSQMEDASKYSKNI